MSGKIIMIIVILAVAGVIAYYAYVSPSKSSTPEATSGGNGVISPIASTSSGLEPLTSGSSTPAASTGPWVPQFLADNGLARATAINNPGNK